ncbi:hypothetical protein [Pontibacter virosus]|uniref:Cysteine rich repeat protein n=1 Tax=Pontibacter virosus TaxID=1765052 RepID=A0A2U1AL35_9BACT|nr:hypothetical protein [Pontibacter virosus]PVY37128.1 hypothetical protein C8E01_1232 [Pontibacter virosus]
MKKLNVRLAFVAALGAFFSFIPNASFATDSCSPGSTATVCESGFQEMREAIKEACGDRSENVLIRVIEGC